MRISRMNKIRNEEVRLRMGIERNIINDTERKQLTWYGRAQQMEETRLQWKFLHWITQGHKERRKTKKIGWKE